MNQKALPINKSFSFIWKEKTYAVSHAPAEALPIMPVYVDNNSTPTIISNLLEENVFPSF